MKTVPRSGWPPRALFRGQYAGGDENSPDDHVDADFLGPIGGIMEYIARNHAIKGNQGGGRARTPTMNFSTRVHPFSHLLMNHPPSSPHPPLSKGAGGFLGTSLTRLHTQGLPGQLNQGRVMFEVLDDLVLDRHEVIAPLGQFFLARIKEFHPLTP